MKKTLIALAAFSLCLAAETVKPSWLGNSLGKEGLSADYIEPGYGLKPLQLFGKTAVMDFKRVTLGENGLPASIEVNDVKVLSAPVRLDASLAGRKLPMKSVRSTFKKSGKNQLQGQFVTAGNDLEMTVDVKVEFDFAFNYTIAVKPKKPVKLDKLLLEIPMALPDDKLMALNLEPPNRPISGLEKERRRPRFNFKTNDLFEYEYAPELWLGNTHYGVSLYFNSGANWRNQQNKEIAFDPKSSILTYRLIDKPVLFDKPETYHFYFIVTPLRRMPKDWRDWRVRTRFNNYTETTGNQMIYWQNWRISAIEMHNNLWVSGGEELKALAAKDKAKGRSRMAYKAPILITNTAMYEKDGKAYVLEDPYLREICMKNIQAPGYYSPKFTIPDDAIRFTDVASLVKALGVQSKDLHRMKSKNITLSVCRTPEIIDYEIAAVNNILDHGANGVYYDGLASSIRYNAKDERGNVRGTYEMELARDFFKRSRALMRGRDPNCHMIGHNTGNRYAPALSMFDMQLFGENHFYWYQEPDKRDLSKNGDYYYAHIFGDIDNLKVDFSRQWGLPQVLLPELRGKDYRTVKDPVKGTRTMLAYVIQFDMLLWTSWCDAQQIHKYDDIRQRWNMKDTAFDTVDFIPYWENKTFTCPDENVKIGYYERKVQLDPDLPKNPNRKYLTLVSNIQFGDTETTLTLPKLTNAKVIDRWDNNREYPVKDGKVNFKLEPYGFMVLEITGQEEPLP